MTTLLNDVADAADAFDGPTDFGGGLIVDLKQLVTNPENLRKLLPQVKENSFLGFTERDSTLGGVLPETDSAGFADLLGEADLLLEASGYAQYIQDLTAGGTILFGNDSEDGDLDSDGRSNISEYYFGGDAGEPDAAAQIPVADLVTAPSGEQFCISFIRRIRANDIRYVVAVSDDLSTWDYSETRVEEVGSPVPVGDGFYERATVKLIGGVSNLPQTGYLRVHAVGR